jgi:hypothetical protein
MKQLRFLAIVSTFLLINHIPTAQAQSAQKVPMWTNPRNPQGTIMIMGAQRMDKYRRWITAAGASIRVMNRQTGAVVAGGILDRNGNWSCSVPAGAAYLVVASYDGGRSTGTCNVSISPRGATVTPRLRIM